MSASDLLSEFLTEAEEHLEAIEEDVLALERGAAGDEAVHRLFRALHTIKGGSSFLPLGPVTELSHALENIVGRVRAGSLNLDGDVAGCLLAGIDRLRLLVESPDETASIEAELRRLEAYRDDADEDDASGAPDGDSDELPASAFDLSRLDIDTIRSRKRHIFEGTLDLGAIFADGSRSAESLADDFESVGELLDDSPSLQSVAASEDADGGGLYSFLLSSVVDDPTEFAEILDLQPLRLVEHDTDLLCRIAGSGDPVQPEAHPAPFVEVEAAGEAAPPAATNDESACGTEASQRRGPSETTVRIPVGLLDRLMNLAGELVLIRNQNMQAVASRDHAQLDVVSQRLNVVTSDLQCSVMQTRLRQVGTVLGRYRRQVRDLSQKLGKEVVLDVLGSEVELDKGIIEQIVDPLTHLVRNSVDHGIETPEERRRAGKPPWGRIVLSASHRAGRVHLEIRDDGRGLDPEAIRRSAVARGLLPEAEAAALPAHDVLRLVFTAGLSTREVVTDVSGRGVGLDVVAQRIRTIGGSVEVRSKAGEGTTFVVSLPLTLAILPALVVSAGSGVYAVPQANISEVVWLRPGATERVKTIDGREVYWLRGQLLPVLRLAGLLEESIDAADPDRDSYLVVLELGAERFGLLVDKVLDTQEIVAKALPEQLQVAEVFAGTTVLGDGRIAMIIDVAAVARAGDLQPDSGATDSAPQFDSVREDRQSVLLFDIGGPERFALPVHHIRRVEEVRTDAIRRAQGQELLDRDGVLMPLVRLERVLPELEASYGDAIHVLVPRGGPPIGIAVAHLHDTLDLDARVQTIATRPGVVGTTVIDGAVALLPDIFAIAELAHPGWFARPTGGGRKALLVEDSAFYAALLTPALRNAGLEAVLATSEKDALEARAAGSFDVTIGDLEVSGLTASEFGRQCREHDTGAGRLIAFSSRSDRTAETRVLEAGFDALACKADVGRLVDSLTSEVRRREAA